MNKRDSNGTRMEMLKMSFADNKSNETKNLLNSWSIRDLYDLQAHAEIAEVISMEEGKLKPEQLLLILEVLNDKGNKLKDLIWEHVKELGEILEYEDERIDDITTLVRSIFKMRGELPNAALKEIESQCPEWKRYFKLNWPTIRKKYMGR